MTGKRNYQLDVRSLAKLKETGCTSRVLNLAQIASTNANDQDYTLKPFFHDRRMNVSILIKHALRSSELSLFVKPRRMATKLLLPFDPCDLKLGGYAIFVDQVGFDDFVREFYSSDDEHAAYDIEVLRALDELPSLDPFLVREHLGRKAIKPASCYLKISNSDMEKMFEFAKSEIQSLVTKAFGAELNCGTSKLARKILNNEADTELRPLRDVLGLSHAEFSDGIFSWRGFLYFKWRYSNFKHQLIAVVGGLMGYHPKPTTDTEIREYISTSRRRLAKKMAAAMQRVGYILDVYSEAYSTLVYAQNSSPFRNFLKNGHTLFYELGETLGVLGHINSFWSYKMSTAKFNNRLSSEQFRDLITEFEENLTGLQTGLVPVDNLLTLDDSKQEFTWV